MTEHDLVVVANRLPVDRREGPDGTVSWQPSPGGLVAALEPVMRSNSGAWVGWTGSPGEAPEPFDARGIRLIPVPLDEEEVQDFYEGMSNGTLWPLYHDVVVPPQFHRSWWDAYVKVNHRFAEAAAQQAGDGALVWVQDYQLQLVPQFLRQLRPDLRIAFFNHIPFPPYEIFAQLPWRRAVLEGLLGADQLGFQRPADAGNFLRACRRNGLTTRRGLVQLPDEERFGSAQSHPRREVRAAAFPISIDAKAADELARDPATQERAREIRRELGDPEIVLLGVDRLDYTKGILHRLKAVEELLEDGQLTAERAVLVQVATPSRERVEEYLQLRQEVEETVGRINGDHGRIGHPAVHYLHQAYDRTELAAMYLAADVLLVTALRDGMNLVAKEYVASRPDERGALVLSEFAGAAIELPQSFLINPHDIDGVKAAIMRAAQVQPKDAQRRMRAMRRRVFEHDVARWAATFLQVAGSAPDQDRPPAIPQPAPVRGRAVFRRGSSAVPSTLPADLVGALEGFAMRSRLLIALDFDGVLAPIVSQPDTARMLRQSQEHLAVLTGLPEIRVALVSGRTLADLRAVADPPPGTVLIGSHGAEISDPGGNGDQLVPVDEAALKLLQGLTSELNRISAEFEGTRVEVKPAGAVLHTRQADRSVAARATIAAMDGPASWPGIQLTKGKEVVELSVVDVTKGTAIRELRQHLGAEAVLYAGDDATDERAFAVLNGEMGDVSVRVGSGETVARYRLGSPDEVAAMLGFLVELCTE